MLGQSQVRAGALVAVGTWLGSVDALLALKDSAVLWAHASKWATSAGDALLDTAHAVCAAAFAAVRCVCQGAVSALILWGHPHALTPFDVCGRHCYGVGSAMVAVLLACVMLRHVRCMS